MRRSAGGSRPEARAEASVEALLIASLETTKVLIRMWVEGRRWSISVRRVVKLTGVDGVLGRTVAGVVLSKLERMGYLRRLNGGRAKKKYAPTPLGIAWARVCNPGNCSRCPLRACPYGGVVVKSSSSSGVGSTDTLSLFLPDFSIPLPVGADTNSSASASDSL